MESVQEAQAEIGVFETDVSNFGARLVRGKRRRGRGGQDALGLFLNRSEKVFVTIVPDCSRGEEALMLSFKKN